MLALDILNKYKINKYKNLCSGIYLGDDYSDGVDSYSKDIEECDEAIKELEALENRSCEGCKYHLSDNGNYPLHPCGECSRFYSDNWESKC